jgi:hypothetical protein
MLTAKHPSISTAIRIDLAPLGFGVYLEDEYLGLVEEYPVWGLDTGYDAALAQGLSARDICYVANNQPYKTIESAVGALTAAYLTQPGRVKLPDYI